MFHVRKVTDTCRQTYKGGCVGVCCCSLKPNQKFHENDGGKKKFRPHVRKLKLKCNKEQSRTLSALTFQMIWDLSCDNTDPRKRLKASSGEDTAHCFLRLINTLPLYPLPEDMSFCFFRKQIQSESRSSYSAEIIKEHWSDARCAIAVPTHSVVLRRLTTDRRSALLVECTG